MTEEELQELYDYLHENYEYKEGELINKKNNKILGYFYVCERGARFIGNIKIKNKRYTKLISHFIWIYHKKSYPKYVGFLDGNITNLNIENLEALNSPVKLHSNVSRHSKGICKSNKNLKNPFTAQIMLNRKTIYLGSYETEEETFDIYKSAKKLSSIYQNKNELLHHLRNIHPNLNLKKQLNKTGLKGIYIQSNGRFGSNIRIKEKTIYLGTYNTPEEAHQAYLKAKEEYAKNP
jgi:hypothetical protein